MCCLDRAPLPAGEGPGAAMRGAELGFSLSWSHLHPRAQRGADAKRQSAGFGGLVPPSEAARICVEVSRAGTPTSH